MINRVLLRIKILQTVYAFYKSEGTSVSLAEKELFYSIEKAYELYFHLLNLIVEVTHFAENKLDARMNKLRPTEEDLNPNRRFVQNKVVGIIQKNQQIQDFLIQSKISWANNQDVVKDVYDLITTSEFYQNYMNAETADFKMDKDIWRQVFKKIVLNNEDIYYAVEEQSVFWIDCLDVIVSFVIKTIKNFEEGETQQTVLPMFKDEEDEDFAIRLLQNTLKNEQFYRELIDKHTRNWEFDRIAYMDILIMQIALAEIMTFPTIPLNVTFNEYIEISKKYSTDKSATFINGVLDNIVKELKQDNKFIKVVKI